MNQHPTVALSAYADGELSAEETRALEQHLDGCTECARELALIQSIGGAMRGMDVGGPRPSVWDRVHRRITRPVGWLLFVAGLSLWAGLALVAWFREALTLEWIAATAVAAGLLVLAIGIAHDQYREWKHSPYKDIQR